MMLNVSIHDGNQAAKPIIKSKAKDKYEGK